MPNGAPTLPDKNWLYQWPPLLNTRQGGPMTVSSTDIEESLSVFGINWTVDTRPIFLRHDGTSLITIPTNHAEVNGASDAVLGIFGTKHRPVQHVDFFRQLGPLLDPVSLLVFDGGWLHGGKIVILRATSNRGLVDLDTPARLVLSVHHNGQRAPAIKIFASNRTLGIDYPIGSVGVGSNRSPKIPEDIDADIYAAIDCASTLVELARGIPVTGDDVLKRYFLKVYNRPDSTTIRRLFDIYRHLLPFYDASFWLAFITICVYEDYKVYHSPAEQDRRAEHSLFGLGAQIKHRALGLISP